MKYYEIINKKMPWGRSKYEHNSFALSKHPVIENIPHFLVFFFYTWVGKSSNMSLGYLYRLICMPISISLGLLEVAYNLIDVDDGRRWNIVLGIRFTIKQ